MFRLARAVYAEMVLSGVSGVGEFHYVHHAAEGQRYADPDAMGEALRAAAREAGLRLLCSIRATSLVASASR